MNEEDAVIARAAALDLIISDEYRCEVLRNLTLIKHYTTLVFALDLPDRLEPAYEYEP